MVRVILCSLILCGVPGLASAWDFVCTGVRPQCADTVGLNGYLRGLDLHEVTDPSCSVIADEPPSLTQAQRDLVATVAASHPNGRCHLKVVDGLAVEMDASEKTAVNTAIQAVTDAQQALEDEANDPQCRNATLEQIDTFFDNLSNNPNNTDDLAGDVAALTTNTAAAIRNMESATLQRLVQVLRKMAKCIRATR